MVRGIFLSALCLAFSTSACGGSHAPDGNGNSGGSAASSGSLNGASASSESGTGGSSGSSTTAPNCDGAFAVIPTPYAPNTGLEEWGGFEVDERGAVFSVIPDSKLTEDTSDLPTLIMASDLSGNVTTLYTDDGSSLFGNFILHGDAVYMLVGPVLPGIARMDRSGGAPVEIVEGSVVAGPILRGDAIYYAKAAFTDGGIYRLDPDTDESTLLVAREDDIEALDLDADTLYWIESDGLLEETDYRLFKMPAAGGTPEMVQSLARGPLALGSFRVIDGVLFGSEITEDFDVVVTRTPIGSAPAVVDDFGGLPLVYGGGFAYYGAGGGGVIKAPLSFASKSTLAGSEDHSVYSIALGPSDLWYSELSCIFRTAK